MRNRNIKKQFWINENEEKLLQQKSIKAGLSEAEFLRCLIRGTKLKEKPSKELNEFLKQITGIANNINQIARAVNYTRNIYADEIEKIKKSLSNFIYNFEKEFYS